LTIALRISPADLTPPWPAGTAVRCPKIDRHDPQRLSNLHFLRIGENSTAANTASKTSCLGWQTAIVGFMKIDKNWRIA
jgi:hypothetical protein